MKLILTLAFAALLILLNTSVFAQVVLESQNAPDDSKQLSQTDLIKLVTKAPSLKNFSSEEDYIKAKNTWIAENPDAYAIINGGHGKSNNSAESQEYPENSNQGAYDKDAVIINEVGISPKEIKAPND